MSNQTFDIWGHRLPYYHHDANQTWRNERAVELPIAHAWIRRLHQPCRGLEIGNVLWWYMLHPDGWRTIDLHEKHPGVENIDLIGWDEPGAFDAVVSISTIEHVGWDDGRCQDCAVLALDAVVSSLADGGSALVTVPLGWNGPLDRFLLEESAPWPLRACTLVRDDLGEPWRQTDHLDPRPYIGDGDGALSVWVGQLGVPLL